MNLDDFVDCGTYYLLKEPQGSEKWLASRPKGSASTLGYLVGLAKKPDIQQSEEEKEFNFAIGHYGEELLKTWFSKTYKVEIKNISLAIPKWDTTLGASVDGVGEDFIIECKTTKRLYPHLKEVIKRDAKKEKRGPPVDYIYPAHYCQMHAGMAILGKKKCYYLVYAYEEGDIFIDTILYDDNYWQNIYKKYKALNEKKA